MFDGLTGLLGIICEPPLDNPDTASPFDIAAVFSPLALPGGALFPIIAVLEEDGGPSAMEEEAPMCCDPPVGAPAVSDSFSGEDGPSLEPVSYVIGLYGGISFTLPPFFYMTIA